MRPIKPARAYLNILLLFIFKGLVIGTSLFVTLPF